MVERLLRLDEARERVLGAVYGPLESEIVPISDGLGRVLAEGARSMTALPPWDNSAMDGYAARSADLEGASPERPVLLTVVEDVRAGFAPVRALGPGQATRIATGAPIPPGADTVVPVEQTSPASVDGSPLGPAGAAIDGPAPAACLVYAAPGPGGSIRRRASDLEADLEIASPGTALGPAELALLAGAGLSHVRVHRRPRVGVLATGDEVRPPGEDLGRAGIPDANGPGLAALSRSAGADVRPLGIAPDRLEAVQAALRDAMDWADLVIVSGGVSVGPYDVVRSAFASMGTVELWRVAVQPGKPFAFGRAARPSPVPPVLLFGLPGNPVSTFVTFELFVRPVLRRLAGRREDDLLRPVDRAVLCEPVTKSAGRRAFLRVRSDRGAGGGPARDPAGRVMVRLAGGQGSHVLSALAAADALAIVREEVAGLSAGDEVELWWLDRP